MLKNFFYLLLLCVSIPLKFEKKMCKKSLKSFQDFLMENSKIYFYEIKTFIFRRNIQAKEVKYHNKKIQNIGNFGCSNCK